MTKKKLHRQIEKKLEKLQELVEEIVEVQNIDPQDSETWDTDTLYNTLENLKEALKILEDQKSEDGLCSLVDEYQSEAEEE